MTSEQQIIVNARWDKNRVPFGRSSQRNLLLEITAPPKPEASVARPPINLALVIDRSGSMGGPRIEAARRAAAGVVEALGDRDYLSLVIFDNEIETLVEGCVMNDVGKREATRLIESLEPRGSTDLGAGWFKGARCAARLLDAGGFTEGHVLVLSDGHANMGVCNPAELQKHAAELAGRGVKTSVVGIGANYSPLQLDALAEGGRGRLHDAETMNDIVEVVIGELGELHAITARDVRVTVRCPRGVELDLLTRSAVDQRGGNYSVQLGDIVAGACRSIAMRANVPACQLLEVLPFNIIVDWRHSPVQQVPGRENIEAPLRVVPSAEADAQRADRVVVEKVATLWEAVLAYRAMRRNEDHDFVGARLVFEDVHDDYSALVSELSDATERLDRLERSKARVSRHWEGRSKRMAFTSSKKAILAERDFRSKESRAWYQHLDD